MAEQELLIEEAGIEDAEAMLQCLQAVMKESDFMTWDGSVIETVTEAQQFLSHQSERVDSICMVAKLGTKIVGLVNVIGQEGDGDLFIAIRQDYWGYGIGTMLMEVIDDWGRHTPTINRLVLTVQERNQRALSLYMKQGFEMVDSAKNNVLIKNGEVLNLYHMVKTLV